MEETKMTQEELIAKLAAEKKAAIEARIEAEAEAGFVNPYGEGCNYAHFMAAVGKKTVAEYCKGHLTKEQLEWLEKDLKHYKPKK